MPADDDLQPKVFDTLEWALREMDIEAESSVMATTWRNLQKSQVSSLNGELSLIPQYRQERIS